MDHTGSTNIVSAFSEEQTACLTGVSVHKLRYWDRTGFFAPHFANPDRRAAYSRVYSFLDVAALRVLYVLTKQYGVSVRHLRDVAKHLGDMDNGAWSRTTLYVLNRKINFFDPSDGRQKEVVSGQYAIGIPLEKVVSDTKRDIEALSIRDASKIGMIERHRFVVGNAPVVAGTRIAVMAIKNFHEDGYSVDQIIDEYPALSQQDVLAAIAYELKDNAA